MTGRIYLPTTAGAHPTVILLHGRHSSCTVPTGGGSVSNPNRWPCIAPQVNIPSYKGYESTAQNLATHGYAVVSISANAINANDNQLAPDYGAQARGQLVLDTLAMLRKANAGEPVSFHDAATDRTVDLAAALAVSTEADDLGSAPTSATNPGEAITPADLVGAFDLDDVGLMGHSRGGEGVVSAVNLNQKLAKPFGIKSVLPLAPVDFGRETAADTNMLVILPYCDGDVSNQQGQHFSDDSRYAYDDDSLRSTLWVMGADHNFFNSVWTPGKYPLSTSDDWGATSTDAVCGPLAPTNVRLSADDQYDVGVAVMSAWFRLTLGGEDQFLPLFDGSADPTLTSVPSATLWATATAPATKRADIEAFTANTSRVRVYGSATESVCASAGGRTLPQDAQPCATASTLRSTSAMPHWTPASFAPNVPASPMGRFLWTSVSGSTAGSIRVTVPAAARDASEQDALTFKTAPDESVVTGTDLTVTVVDGHGATWSSAVSALNAGAVKRLPISGSTTLNKIVLQQVSVPVSTLAGSIDVSDVREVRFAGATGADGTATGGAYLSDLAFVSSGVGTVAGIASVPTVNVASTVVEEGSSVDEARVAVVLDQPADRTVSAWFTLMGSTADSSNAGLAAQKVTFQPGQTCQAVSVTTLGNTVAGAAATTAYTADVSAPDGVIVGAAQFGTFTVREDDALTSGGALAPAVGTQGDVCAEYAARSVVQELTTSGDAVAGSHVTLTGSGYRVGELVAFTDGDAVLGTVLAGADGTAALDWAVPADARVGGHDVTAVGAGSARTAKATVTVRSATTTTLAIAPAAPAVGKAVTLTATVAGPDTAGTVTFADGSTVLGRVAVKDGRAALVVSGGFDAGTHTLTAAFGQTATAEGSVSPAVTFTLVKGKTTTVFVLAATRTTYGTAVAGRIVVGGADGGVATITVGNVVRSVRLDAHGAGSFTVPGTLKPATYRVTASYAGSRTLDTSSARASLTVLKAAPKVTLSAPATARKGATVTVTVKVVGMKGGVRPTGKAVVKLGGKAVKTVSVPSSGVVKVKVRLASAGTAKVTAAYQGSAYYTAASGAAKVKVVTK
jgi:hypothetical protein